MPRIRTLSPQLIDQIAAGEVVERPASVVKELVENAIDADAATVKVTIDGSGIAGLVVVDDGIGMGREDAMQCIGRHATSKIASAEDLFAIRTNGFRGEALPSIAAVSHLTLTTSEHGARVGTKVTVDHGAPMQVDIAAPIGGTAIEIRALFSNVPARRKFLKREATETHHCREAVARLALGYPRIGFRIDSGGRALLHAAPTKNLAERIVQVLGEEVQPHLRPVHCARLGISVDGFAG